MFSGGGSRGAYQLGVYEALHANGFRPEIVCGTSVGGVLATLVASGASPAEMREAWMRICSPDLMPRRWKLWRVHKWESLRDNQPLQAFFEDLVDWEAVASSDIELRVASVDVCTGQEVVHTNQEVSPARLRGSTAIPVIFPPVETEDRILWDGGITSRTPIQPAIEAGATEIYAILNDPVHGPAHAPPATMREAIERLADIVMEQGLRRDLERGREINRLVDQGIGTHRWRKIHFHIVAPDRKLPVSLLSFDPEDARELMGQGRQDGEAFVQRLHWDQEPV